jgi:hypothetical protein
MARMSSDHDFIGYVKYEGKRLETGAFDARKAATALLGLDEALRHFILYEAPDLRGIDFEIPVKFQKGSWLATIPTDISTLFQLGLGIAATAYLTNGAKKMAEKDFDGVGFTDLFKKGVEAIKWVAKIGKHLGGITQRRFESVKFSEDNELIGIPDQNGEYLFVPRKFFDFYVNCSPKILAKLASNVDPSLVLSIGVVNGSELSIEEIDFRDKKYFVDDEGEEESEVLLPELVHGQQVELEGEVTKENKTSNSMGFKFKGHIITAYPQTGNIIPFKPMLFETCRLIGYVDRIDENGRVGARRPKLIFSELIRIDVGVTGSGDLFP